MTNTVAIVACSAAKRAHPHPARDLYIGELFMRSRRVVERHGIPWAIISARHGLVQPDYVLEPYNQRVSKGARKRAAWERQVVRQLVTGYPAGTHFVVLAGVDYRGAFDSRELASCGMTWSAPMTGLGLGHQKQWLGLHTPPRAAGVDVRGKQLAIALEVA